MDASFSKGVGKLMDVMAIVLIVCIPLAIWKVIDLAWWALTRIRIHIAP